MIPLWIAAGLLPVDFPTIVAPVTVSAARTVLITRAVEGKMAAFAWVPPLDPSDRAPYAFDWSDHLDEGENIATIVAITMSALGASLGVEIDNDAGRQPTLDTAGRRVGFWLKVAPSYQANIAFAGPGVDVELAMLIRTTADPFKELERTATVTVRQQ